MIAGGLGAQPRQADALFDFLETDKIIPFIESTLRVFDRYGERNRRAKARLKHLILDIGLDKFLEYVAKKNKRHYLHQKYTHRYNTALRNPIQKNHIRSLQVPQVKIKDEFAFRNWKQSNVFDQKQKGLFAIGIKVRLGDFYTDKARILADLIRDYAQDELRLTIKSGYFDQRS